MSVFFKYLLPQSSECGIFPSFLKAQLLASLDKHSLPIRIPCPPLYPGIVWLKWRQSHWLRMLTTNWPSCKTTSTNILYTYLSHFSGCVMLHNVVRDKNFTRSTQCDCFTIYIHVTIYISPCSVICNLYISPRSVCNLYISPRSVCNLYISPRSVCNPFLLFISPHAVISMLLFICPRAAKSMTGS